MNLRPNLFVALLAVTTPFCANAQITVRTCGSGPRYTQLAAQEPFAANMRALNQRIQEVFALSGGENAKEYPLVTIPIFVHVLFSPAHDGRPDAGKIALEQIQSQIPVLNGDYHSKPANRSQPNVPARFRNRFASPNIEFSLSPNDVVWIPTSKASFTTTADDAKSKKTGGDDGRDPTKYLNIWIVPILLDGNGNQILGYSSWPSEPAATDGVVIANQMFGTTGTAAAPFNLGRTASHEIGHWLNLHHLWGDGNDNQSCTGSDLADDTPVQSGPNFKCPSGVKISCKNRPDGDMYVNYMDYTDDSCMSMFSKDQVIRMRTTLEKVRTSFLPKP